MPSKEYESLKADIEKRGIQTMIDISEGMVIVCGHQRVKICRELGISEIDARVLTGWSEEQIREHLIKDNILRRQLTPDQIVEAGKELEKIYEGRHHFERDNSGQFINRDGQMSTSVGATRDIVAKDFGISGRTYERYKKAKEIIEERKDPELMKNWRDGKIAPLTIIREKKITEEKEKIKELEPQNKMSGLYDVIVIDPPWAYDNENYKSGFNPDGRRGTTPYPEMQMSELKNIKIPSSEKCVMWLWVTNSFMKNGFDLLEKWGFEPKTILTWDKQIMGVGWWLRNVTEHCILAVKGKPVFDNKKWTTLISEKRREHSRKPEIFFKMVDEICVGRKLDYFGRYKRDGWDLFGIEKEIKK